MKIIRSPGEMYEFSSRAHRSGKKIGFVPTMGCLHDGHIALIRKSRQLADLTVVSIFVNPTQFGPGEDFARYPRVFRRDCLLCAHAGVDAIFHPSVRDIYLTDHTTNVEETSLSESLCGASRPGHFRGVATVVAKLFNIVAPDFAVFGQKDAQQARIVKRMVRDLNFQVRIVTVPTVREPDGLAMSSRNVYLSRTERQRAVCLHQSLRLAKRLVAEGITDTSVITRRMRQLISKGSPQVRIDYIEAVDAESLKRVGKVVKPILVALAVKIGSTRLIDNIVLRP